MREGLVCFETTKWFQRQFCIFIFWCSAHLGNECGTETFWQISSCQDIERQVLCRNRKGPGTIRQFVDWWKQHLRYRLFGLVAKYITQDRKEFVYLFPFFFRSRRVKWKEISSFKKKKKGNFKFCVYIFRAGSNLVSSSIIKNRKEGTNSGIFLFYSFAYWFSRLFDNLHCVTQVCEVSILFPFFRLKKKIVHFFFVFQVFDSVKIQFIWLDKTWCLFSWLGEKKMSNTRREIFSELFKLEKQEEDRHILGVVFTTASSSSHMPTSHVHIKANLIITWI